MSFKEIKLRRGFEDISLLFDICTRHDATICGGYARYCASPLPTHKVIPAKDCDMFPQTEEASEQIRAALIQLGFEVKHENTMSITMKPRKDKSKELSYIPTPQVIKPVEEGHIVTVGTPEKILSNFDFTITRAAILSPTTVLVDEDFEEDEMHHYLRLKNIHCPVSSMLRCMKYAAKGYWMRPIEAIKLFADWSNRDENYRTKLLEFFSRATGGKDNPNALTQEEINELEALLHID